MIKYFYLLLFLLTQFALTAQIPDPDQIAREISVVLKKEYDNYKKNKELTFLEKQVMKAGKKAYIESVDMWLEHYREVDTMKIELHPILETISQISEKHLPGERGAYFRTLLEELTRLAYKNLELYHTAVTEDFMKNGSGVITTEYISDVVADYKYYDRKVQLYKKEAYLEAEMRTMFNEKKLKSRLAFYAFGFEFLFKIRHGITEKDMAEMLRRIERKQRS